MKFKIVCLLFILLSSAELFSQETGLPDSLPTTKEGFIKTEPAVINTINWLENTPLNEQTENRKLLNVTLLSWITNSPTVTIELNSKIVPLSKKNPDLLLIFMGGWTKYSLENNYSKDALKCNVAGLKSLIKVYSMGNGIKKEKDIDKLVELDSKNELESWVSSKLK